MKVTPSHPSFNERDFMGARYTKYVGDLDLEELIDSLLESMMDSFFFSGYRWGPDRIRTLEDLKRALADFLLSGKLLSEEKLNAYLNLFPGAVEEQFEQFIDMLVHHFIDEGYITPMPERVSAVRKDKDVVEEERVTHVRLTGKGLDFLSHKLLEHLFDSHFLSSFGHHETRRFHTGPDAYGEPRPYRFGDTFQLDISRTILNAVRRSGPRFPIHLAYEDIVVLQTEAYRSCGTVIMLDCSHSMILYGEDRFTPAKKVALALSHLIRTQFPGDSVSVVLFHDSAEEIHIRDLPYVEVGPYYTNTFEGLKLSRRILLNQKHPVRQIFMITDGKPSAITLPDGRIYKNPYGFDPFILQETFNEVVHCRKAGIVIHTFMLAHDPFLMGFVEKVRQLSGGQAYYTGIRHPGKQVIKNFLDKRTDFLH